LEPLAEFIKWNSRCNFDSLDEEAAISPEEKTVKTVEEALKASDILAEEVSEKAELRTCETT